MCNRWKNDEKKILYINWEGYQKAQQAYLVAMDTDDHGNSFDFKLLPGEDGTMPTLQACTPAVAPTPAVRPAAAAPAPAPRRERGDAGETVIHNKAGQEWTPRDPKYVKEDWRSAPRNKPSLNHGGRELKTMMQLFLFLLPPQWIEDQLKHTNPLLDESDSVHAKLTKGELLRFYGYMLALTLQDYLPLDKMWSRTSIPGTTAPPPMFGRFGMPINRFMKIKSILRFGPSDDASFDQNSWCFVETLVDAWNEHMFESVHSGWLLGMDESMFAWLGKVGLRDVRKCPHRMFVKRKPEPLGVEMKNIGDALSGMLLFMEIVRGKAEIIKPKYWSVV